MAKNPPVSDEKPGLSRRAFLASGGSALAWVLVSGLPLAPRSSQIPGLESARLALIDPVVGFAGGNSPTVGPGWSTRVALPIPGQMVTFQWEGASAARLAIRSHKASGGWSEWVMADTHDDEGPDLDGRPAFGGHGIGPIWVGEGTDEIEVRIEEGQLTGLELDTLRAEEPNNGGLFGMAAAGAIGSPNIQPRSAWGGGAWEPGNPTCTAQPVLADRLRFIVVHHTVSTNSYTVAEGKKLIQGVYHFHVNTQKWCDVAYNFFIDKYGNVYEGRTGSGAGPVVGGHSAGFNTNSTGIALLGQYHAGASPAASSVSVAQQNALRELIIWLCGEYGIDPQAKINVVSRGSTSIPEGQAVNLSTVAMHRDVGQTSCPGSYAVPLLPTLRRQAAETVGFNAPAKSRWVGQKTGPAMMTLDVFGGLHPAGTSPAMRSPSPYWKGWKIVRGMMLNADGTGYVADAYGGVHPFGGAPRVNVSKYFSGHDLARGITTGPRPGSGYVLDRSGELHHFGGAPATKVSSTWPGPWDVAIAAVSNSSGTGGYVLDAFGAPHAWGDAPKATGVSGYWPGWRIARSIALRPNGTSGWVLDAYGGLHPFGGAPRVNMPAYTPGVDRFRHVVADASGNGGWVLARDGEIYSFGGAPQVTHLSTFTGLGIARTFAVSPTDRGAVA